MTEQPLAGVRIVDVGGSVAGMVATMILAEAGADVVLVEPPGGLRHRAEVGFRTWNRSKRSLQIALDEPTGKAELLELLGNADVFVHSYGPSEALERGLDDATLREINADLIVSSVLAWPVNHPKANMPVDDLLVLADLGICDEQLGRRDGPIFVRFPLGTWTAAWLAVVGVGARLVSRDRTGVAGPAHTSLTQGALIPMMMHWSRAETPSESLRYGMPKGDMQATLFECADGRWIHVMPPPPDQVPLMREVMAEIGPDAVAAANAAHTGAPPSYANWGANIEAFRRRTADQWLQQLWDNDIAAQEATTVGEILSDEQSLANRYVIEIDDPVEGSIKVPGHPMTLEPPSAVQRLAPDVGEGGDDVLRDWLTAGLGRVAPTELAGVAPLSGLKVVDFGNYLAGPLGPMLLADLGATVVKVEAVTGDPMRFVDWAFAGCHRGKKSVALDLKQPTARPAVEKLLQWADVVHHNLRRPAARRLGLDSASVRAVNPQAIFCHVSSYGPVGSRSDWPGYDQLFQASCGWEVLGAGDGNPPMWHRFGFMDHLCAMASAAATLIALFQQGRSGVTTEVATSLLGAGVLTNADTFVNDEGAIAFVPTLDADQTRLSEGERIFEAADDWVAISARTSHELAAARGVLGVEDLDEMLNVARSRTASSLIDELHTARVPATLVRREQRHSFFDDADNIAAGMIAVYPHREWGRFEQPGAAWYLGDQSTTHPLAPPLLGQHTTEVLAEIGLQPDEIEALIEAGAAAAR